MDVAATGRLSFGPEAQLLRKNHEARRAPIDFVRKTGYILKFDYTYFCSPVEDQVAKFITDSSVLPNLNDYYDNPNGTPFGTFLYPRYDKYFIWDENATPVGTDANVYTSGAWLNVPETSLMNPAGRGFIIRGPDSFPAAGQGITQQWQVRFIGEPNSGVITPAIAGTPFTPYAGAQTAVSAPASFPYEPCANGLQNANFIGNPYPSALDADTFLTNPANVSALGGAIYMWAHNSGPSIEYPGNGTEIYNYTVNDYVIYNLVGGVGTGRVTGDPIYAPNESNRPTGKIASCQGFFVNGITNGAGVATFNPDMQDTGIATADQQFYRFADVSIQPSETEMIPTVTKNRFWLSLESTTNTSLYRETLIGYMPQRSIAAQTYTSAYTIPASTNGYENMYDTEVFTTNYNTQLELDSRIEFYTMINSSNACPRLAIQGRMLNNPFNVEDIIPLGFSCPAGTYTIKLELAEGIFETRDFWLREYDEVLDAYTYHDITSDPFTFTTAAVADDTTRFQIVFKLPVVDGLSNVYCNTTLAGFNTLFNSTGQPSQSGMGYNWLFTDADGNAILAPINTPSSNFSLNNVNIPLGFIDFSTTYYIKVGVWNNSLAAWVYSTVPCSLTTPNRVITVAGDNCGADIQVNNQIAKSTNTPYQYSWIVTNTTETWTLGPFVTNNNYFLFRTDSLGPAVFQSNPTFIQPGDEYCFQVAIHFSSSPLIVGDYSEPCCFTAPSPRDFVFQSDLTDFTLAANPNPFTNDFGLTMFNEVDGQIEIAVYDMIGKLMERRTLRASDVSAARFGENYRPGVYNLIVSFGETRKSFKIIKR